jgi:hypothetical protein
MEDTTDSSKDKDRGWILKSPNAYIEVLDPEAEIFGRNVGPIKDAVIIERDKGSTVSAILPSSSYTRRLILF